MLEKTLLDLNGRGKQPEAAYRNPAKAGKGAADLLREDQESFLLTLAVSIEPIQRGNTVLNK